MSRWYLSATAAEILQEEYNSQSIGTETVGTSDCSWSREQQGCRLHWNSCDTLDCVKSKGVEFCFECGEFPCGMLQPASDGAEKYPHNMKVFNLCRIKLVGVEKWAAEEASEIRRKYYKGKFVVGRGPVIE